MEKLDVLNREEFVKQLMQLVENISEDEKSVSFAINGTWGCGKSFVLDMFEKQLEHIQSEETNADKYLIVRYNCWEYDYYEEPLVAIVATIIDTVNKKTKLLSKEKSEKIKGALKAVGTTLLSIPNSALKNATGIDAGEIYSIVKSGVDIGKTEYDKMQEYDMYFGFKQAIHSLQRTLNEISEQYNLVFLVDELDRCLPEYAIKVLERLHHLTENTKKMVNIIAIDKTQLQTSVQHIFGFKDADKYLKKFIHFTVPLDIGIASEKVVEKYSEYIALFDQEMLLMEDSLEEFMQAVFKDIGIREQEQIMHRALIAHKLLYSGTRDYSFMCIEILIVVLFFAYDNRRYFSEWFQKFTKIRETNKEIVPFSAFFTDKLNKIPYIEINHSGYFQAREYSFQTAKSLYGCIAYIWREMFFKNSYGFISVPDKKVEDLLKGNVEELEKFSDMIRFVR